MRFTSQKVNKIFGLAYTSTAEMELKTGAAVAQIIIDTRDAGGNATLDADQLAMTLELNGDPIVPALTGKELNYFRKFDDQVATPGVYILDYFDFKASSITGEQEGALLTNGGDNLVMKITAAAQRLAVAAGSGVDQPVIPVLNVRVKYVDVVDAKGMRVQRTAATKVRVMRRKTITTNSTGEVEWAVKDGRPLIRRVALVGDIDHLSVKVSGKDQLDKISKADLEFDQKMFGRVPQPGVLMFDPGMTGRKLADRLDAEKLDLEINPWAASAGSIQVLMDNFETGRGV